VYIIYYAACNCFIYLLNNSLARFCLRDYETVVAVPVVFPLLAQLKIKPPSKARLKLPDLGGLCTEKTTSSAFKQQMQWLHSGKYVTPCPWTAFE